MLNPCTSFSFSATASRQPARGLYRHQ